MWGKNKIVHVLEKASLAAGSRLHKNTAYPHLWGFSQPFLLKIASRRPGMRTAKGPKVFKVLRVRAMRVFRVCSGVERCMGLTVYVV